MLTKLTASFAKTATCEPDKERSIYWDSTTPGFGLCVTRNNARSYVVQYRANGASRRQVHTIAEEIDAAMSAEGETRLGIEGYEAAKWVVQDYGDVVVHVFDPDTRGYFALDDLWADARRLDWEER